MGNKVTDLIKDKISASSPKNNPSGSKAPRRLITQNQSNSDQRSNSWVVCFISYNNPVPSYFRDDKETVRIVTNDAISVTTSGSKGSFGKSAQISLKSTDVLYPSVVSNGDWCFIWMVDNMTDRQVILDALALIQKGDTASNILISRESGLKFVGRVTSCNSSDITQGGGQRTIAQNISAQSFLEFASTVYNTGSNVKLEPEIPVGGVGVLTTQAFAERVQNQAIEYQVTDSLSGFTKRIAEAFKSLMNKEDPSFNSPDRVISLYYVLTMGIDKPQEYLPGVPSNFNSGITLPKSVSAIFNKRSATKLWQLIDIHAGIQKFTSNETAWYKGFVPKLKSDKAQNLKTTGIATKGYVPFKFELWENMSVWSILNRHLNPVVNEMFTSLRLNADGNLNLTLTIREKPLSTGLFYSIAKNHKYYTSKNATNPPDNKLKKSAADTEIPAELKLAQGSGSGGDKKIPLTLFGEVPRWVIDDSIVRSYSSSTNENDRVNFVIVWGRSTQAEMLNPKVSLDSFMSQQFHNGNYYLNPGDISRNGLRSVVMESHYDTYYSDRKAVSNAGLWARQNADWMFNGHLKLRASLTVNGIQDPIVEGDNLEYRGILYHIDSVSHNASLSASGQKTWTTTLSLSNGLLASSLDDPTALPLYAYHQSADREELKYPLAPGITSVKTE